MSDVRLREVRTDDPRIFFEHQVDPVAVHMAAFTAKDPSDLAAHLAHWVRNLGDPAGMTRTILVDGRVAGNVVSFAADGVRYVSYWVAREHWGRGVATRALSLFLREDRDRPLRARAAADNAASIRVLEKCGFTLCGRGRGFANARGAETDEVVLVLPAEETRVCLASSVHWYETMFRLHGLSWEVADGVGTSRGVPPPYHGNAITVAPSGIPRQVETLRALQAAIGGSFGVKDSWALLDLAPLGFRTLFDATWVFRDAGAAPPAASPGVSWRRVRTEAELETWQAAWRENGSPCASPVFLPAVLASDAIALFAARRGDRIAGGFAANRTAASVGFSNFFAADGDVEELTAGGVAETMRFAPALPVVGYDRDEALARLLRLGFRAVGPLRVWIGA